MSTHHRYNGAGLKVATIDPQGNETLFFYDVFKNLTETSYPTSGKRATEKWTYDALGNKLSHTDPLGNITRTRYTVRGQPYHITYPDGSIETKAYSPEGRLIKETAKNGLKTVYKRDAFGRITSTSLYDRSEKLLKSTSATYNTFHRLTETDEEGCVTTYAYDSAGRKAVEQRDERLTHYVYDHLGRLALTIENCSRSTYFMYDLLNRLIEKRIEDEKGVFTKELYAYDPLGNRTETTTFAENGPSVAKTAYTPHKKPYWEQDALGNETFTIYDYFFPYKESLVLKVTSIDPLGNKEVTLLDAKGKKLQQSRLDFLDNIVQQETHEYDLCGRLVSTTSLNGVATTWEWDAMGREIRCTEAGVKTTSHTYNSFGQKTSTLTPKGDILHFEYDLLGRLAFQKSSDIHYSYIYDKSDRLLSATNELAGAATHRSYDLLGRLTSETLENGLKMSYAYDAFDRINLITLPDSSAIRYMYDGCRLLAVERPYYIHRYLSYDLAGQPIAEKLIDGSTLLRSMNPLHLPSSIKAPHREEVLSYDKAGNLTTRTVNGLETHYTYDPLYQLISETDFTYRYDSQANRIEKNGAPYSLNPLNQILAEKNNSYIYDKNGNLTEKNQSTHFSYDTLNRLVKVVGADFEAAYTYDAFHRRLTKTVNGQEECYLYQNNSEIGAYVDGCLRELRILGLGLSADIGSTIAIEMENKHYAPLHDSSGSIVLLLNNGTPCQAYQATAFGESKSYPKTPWLFSSKRFDPETGFFYFGKRYFDPTLGRWITPDPAGFADGLNLYAYAHNSPLMYIDPDGQFAFLPILAYMAVSYIVDTAICAALPYAAAAVEATIGGTAAAVVTGIANGYTGVAGLDTLGEVGLAEQTGVAFGMGFAYRNIVKKGAVSTIEAVAQSQVGKYAGNLLKRVKFGKACTTRANIANVTETTGKVVKSALENGITRNATPSLDSLSNAGKLMDRGGLTKAGGALDKHGGRPGSVFPKAAGNSLNKNIQGQYHLDNILTHPNSGVHLRTHKQFGEIIDMKVPGVGGARFTINNEMVGFLEP